MHSCAHFRGKGFRLVTGLFLFIALSMAIPMVSATPASASSPAPISFGAPSVAPATLGVSLPPIPSLSDIANGALIFAKGLGCSPFIGGPAVFAVNLIDPAVGTHNCPTAGQVAGAVVGAVADVVVQGLINGAVNQVALAGSGLADWVLNGELGGRNCAQSPQPDPNSAPANSYCAQQLRASGASGWFMDQYSLMRQIALFLLLPFMMIVIIQSVVRGSMFFLLRSVLVMLPIAILGTAVAMKFTELMLAISDDFSNFVLHSSPSWGDLATGIQNSMLPFKEGSPNKSNVPIGLFHLFWLLMLVISLVTVWLELLMREIGVYLAAFFLPIGFAGLVWPATSKWARRLVELILALIFSKVFIAVALTLAMAGFKSTIGGQTSSIGNLTLTAASTSPWDSQINVPMIEAALFIMVAFVGAKVLTFAPGAAAVATARGHFNHAAIFGKGSLLNFYTGKAVKWTKPGDAKPPIGAFQNSAASNGATGGSKLPVLGAPPPISKSLSNPPPPKSLPPPKPSGGP